MADYIDRLTFEWDPVGYRTFVPAESNHSGVTLSTHSAHLVIENRSDGFTTRMVSFGDDSKRTTDEILELSPDEVRTMCDLPRTRQATNPLFTDALGVDVGIENKFARRGGRITVFVRGKKFYFYAHSWPMAVLARYMDHHFPDN